MAQKKIEEWIKEIQERPTSASLIINYIAGRLQDLSKRNEELLAEVIALQSGNRVEEYERRIAHLEYQLELLKRGKVAIQDEVISQHEAHGTTSSTRNSMQNLLIYASDGRVLRIPLPAPGFDQSQMLARLAGIPGADSEPLRMLAVDSSDELLFLFTSGRIATLPLTSIHAEASFMDQVKSSQPAVVAWPSAVIPVPPRTNETLACIVSISDISLADYFVQVSRRGYVKKIRIGMADGILQNRYIGMGIHKPPDRTFDLLLFQSSDRIALVSWEGWLVIQEVKDLPVSLGQVQRLTTTDHLVRLLNVETDKSIVVMTNIGKIVHFSKERLEPTEKIPSKGATLLSARRREEEVRVVDAICVSDRDFGCVLEKSGTLSVCSVVKLAGSGKVDADSEILAFCKLAGDISGE